MNTAESVTIHRGETPLEVEVVLTDGPKIQIEHVGDVGDPGKATCPWCLGRARIPRKCVDLTEDEQADAHDLATDLRIQRQAEYDSAAEYAADRHADQLRDLDIHERIRHDDRDTPNYKEPAK